MNFCLETEMKDGRPIKVCIKWSVDDEVKELVFEYDITFKFIEENSTLFVEIYEINKIKTFDLQACLMNEYQIPELEGYQFRGINKNSSSKTGISLLYFPINENVGNEWRDLEQYELVDSDMVLGKKLGIYR